MALVQGIQTVLFSHIQQLQSPHQSLECSSNLKDFSCKSFRGNPGLGSQTKRIISSEGRKQRFARLRFFQQEPEWLTYRSKLRGKKFVLGLVNCLQTRQVEQAEDALPEEKTLDHSVEIKKGDVTETDEWAVKKGLNALNAYFDKLHASRAEETSSSTVRPQGADSGVSTTVSPPKADSSGLVVTSKVADAGNVVKDRVEGDGIKSKPDAHSDKSGFDALDAYFGKLREPEKIASSYEDIKKAVEEGKQSAVNEEKEVNIKVVGASETSAEQDEELEYRELMKELEKALQQQAESGKLLSAENENFMQGSSWGLQAATPTSYFVNSLVALNIAVYLFGLASPLEVPGMVDASLPYLYGAKVNELIVNGDWWRLVTPMFLHSGLLHLGLSTWALLEFGPAVESAYGTLGFAMIYLLGGAYGNLLSFFHTPQGTVGGSGPIFAVMAAWVVYILRNRDIIGLDVAGEIVRKVLIFTAITYALCNSFPIDDWTHLGAAISGLSFGVLTCPLVRVNVHVEDVNDENDDDAMESYLLLNEGIHPYRLLLVFGLSVAVFFALYSVGVPYATEFHFLHGGLGDEYW